MTEESVLPTLESVSVPTTTIAPIVRTLETELIATTLKTMNDTIGNITETVTEIFINVTEVMTEPPPTLAPPINWKEATNLDADTLDCIYNLAGVQLGLAIVTILFGIVIGIYGPYVFGSQALVKGMSVATDFWEFFLPVKYAGKPAEEKMDSYTQDAYVSKIRRFGAFIAFTMSAFAVLEMMTGAIGHSALKNHNAGEGNTHLFDAHVTLCVVCGITSFLLLCSSIQMFRHRFLPEMMMVYSIRNLAMLCLFTANWMRALGVDEQIEKQIQQTINDTVSSIGKLHEGATDLIGSTNIGTN